MADISQEINAFQTAVYGEEVRSSMVSLANKLNEEVEADTSNVSNYTADIEGKITTLDGELVTVQGMQNTLNTQQSEARTLVSNAEGYKNAAATSASDAAASAQISTNESLESEGWAVGTQGGLPVAQGSPYYQNNAKYYKDQAESASYQQANWLEDIPTQSSYINNRPFKNIGYGLTVENDILKSNVPLASTSVAGLVCPDGDSITIGADGKIHANPPDDYDQLVTDVSNVKGIVSNPNLLDNGWFTLNSRAISIGTEITTSALGYQMDRWVFNSGKTFTYSSDNIVTSSKLDMWQIISNSTLKGKVVTASILFSDGSVLSGKRTMPTTTPSGNDFVTVATKTGLQLLVGALASGKYQVSVIISGTSYSIKAIKLELGSVSTLAIDVAPNYSEEYIKCITSKADASDTYANKPVNFASNENLIDNPFFTVNQRNATSASTSYGFDRWIGVYSISGSTLVMANGNYTIQALDENLKASLDRKTITLSVLYSDGTIESGKATYSRNPSDWISPIISNRIYGQIQVNTGNVAITALASINIKAIKLEIGTVSTLAIDVAPNYAEEKYKCQNSKASTSDTYSNGMFAIVEGTSPNSTSANITLCNYPTGFNYNNCVVIGTMYQTSSGTWMNNNSATGIYAQLRSSNVVIYSDGAEERRSRPVKITLMKICNAN